MYIRANVCLKSKILYLYIAKISTIILHQTASYSSKYIYLSITVFAVKITFFFELRFFN